MSQDVQDGGSGPSLPPPWDQIFSVGTRLFVWGLFFGCLYILGPFLLPIFLTFVFAYIQAHGVDGLEKRIQSRGLRVVLVFLVFLGTIVGTGYFLAPKLVEQGRLLKDELPQILAEANTALDRFVTESGFFSTEEVAGEGGEFVENGDGARPGGDGKREANGTESGSAPSTGTQDPEATDPADSTSGDERATSNDGANGKAKKDEGPPQYVEEFLATVGIDLRVDPAGGGRGPNEVVERLRSVATPVFGFTSAFGLALLFSFLIVLDLKNISRGIRGLSNTRIGFIYDEVADNVHHFGKVLGRALEAQLLIAIVNTVLTALVIWMMGLPNIVFLSAIVFLCGFLPVAGTFLSSGPICLIALQHDGVGLMVVAIIAITVIHMIEAYILNPRIFGHHLRMNPVFVLIVLTISGQLFGLWGLILGLPLMNYIFRHAIRRTPEEDVPEGAAVEGRG